MQCPLCNFCISEAHPCDAQHFCLVFLWTNQEYITNPKLFARMTPLDPGQHQIKYTTWRFLWLTHNTNFRFLVFSHWQLTTIKEISYSSFLLVNAKWISLQINFFTPLLQSLKQSYGQQLFLLSLPILSPPYSFQNHPFKFKVVYMSLSQRCLGNLSPFSVAFIVTAYQLCLVCLPRRLCEDWGAGTAPARRLQHS